MKLSAKKELENKIRENQGKKKTQVKRTNPENKKSYEKQINHDKENRQDKPINKDKRSHQDKPVNKDKRSYQDKPINKDKRSYEDKPINKDKRSYQDKSINKDKRSYEDKPINKDKKSYEDKPIYKDKKRNQDNRSSRNNPDVKPRWNESKSVNGKIIGDRKPESKRKNASMNDDFCSVAEKCGGCQLQGVPYDKQLEKKQKRVNESLSIYGKVHPIIGMKDPYHYRNKVHAVFGRLRNGTIISGVYQEGTHFIVPIDSCQIENKKADAIICDIRGLLKSFKIKTYDEDTGYGLLRHVLIRTGYKSGEIMVVMVLGSPILPSKNNFVKALRKLHPEITTVVININDKKTSMILGERETTLYGKGYIEDTLCGRVFRISPKSFYQVNPVQTEILYQKAITMAGLTGKERIIDAYCGIGTIGLIASKKAKEVIGVELNKDAVKDAIINAKRNEVKNICFYQQDAGTFMTQMATEGEKADVVFMDPPRAGSDEAFLSSLIKLSPKKIVYVSCNPESQARDLKYLTKSGYVVKEIQPVDMFPMTGHVETVILMTRCGKNDK